MKISEMNNTQACDAMVRISQPAANIMDDPAVEELLKNIADNDKDEHQSNLKVIASALPKLIPIALKDHREDFFEIVGALTDKTAAQVAKMKFTDTIKEIRDSLDDELIGFFTSSGKAGAKPGNE